jgi:hypothetical protein
VIYRKAAFCCVCFCGSVDLVQRIFLKKCFLFMVGSVCYIKCFTADDEEEPEVQKWLSQQSKDFVLWVSMHW